MNLKKILPAAICAMTFVAFADEVPEVPSAEDGEDIGSSEEKSYEVGVDLDWFTAYIWRNAVMNNQMVMQPCIWGEWNFFGPLTLGGFIWQNYDLTGHRRNAFGTGLCETDYNIHLNGAVWEVEEEGYKLTLELGHEWFTYYRQRSGARADEPDTRELYLKGELENPYVNIYAQASWMYGDFGDNKSGFNYELGLKREVEIGDDVTLGGDWSVAMADRHYTEFLFGERARGFGGTTLKGYASYAITEWCSIKATLAYTGILNANLRDMIGDEGSDYDFYGHRYPRDILWGGISLNLEF